MTVFSNTDVCRKEMSVVNRCLYYKGVCIRDMSEISLY